MGGCVSRPESCVSASSNKKKKNKLKKKKKNSFFPFEAVSYISIGSPHRIPSSSSFYFLALAGSIDDLWYDSAAVLESDCSDEDFHSALNDMLPLDGSEGVSRPNISAVRDGESRRSSVHPVDVSRCSGSLNDGISPSMDDCSERDNDGLFDCGIIPSNCLPCLATTDTSVDKRSSSSSPSTTGKKATHKLSFKCKDEDLNASFGGYFLGSYYRLKR
ncbi:hypothetical protein Tco_0760537 [Tanacetum coccineum]